MNTFDFEIFAFIGQNSDLKLEHKDILFLII